MLLLLNIWYALILGILYLTFQALAFLGMATGMVLGLFTQPYWNRRYSTTITKTPTARKSRRRSSDSGWGRSVACLCPSRSSCYCSVHDVSRCAPDRAGARVGPVWHGYLLHLRVFLHVHCRRAPVDRVNSRLRATRRCARPFAAAFPLFAGKMYGTLGTVGATVLLAGHDDRHGATPAKSYPLCLPPALD